MTDMIKLFGSTITQLQYLPSFNESSSTTADDLNCVRMTTTTSTSSDHNLTCSSSSSIGSMNRHDHKNAATEKETEQSSTANKTEAELPSSCQDKLESTTSENKNENTKEGEEKSTTSTTSSGGGGDSLQEPLKKPDKILPCPRCKSTDTKFCYFNNYNVNQPRHFCRCCQRYWTAGGTMRNVPVGSGRRNNNNKKSNQQPPLHVLVPGGGPTTVEPAGMGFIYYNPTAATTMPHGPPPPPNLFQPPPPPSHHHPYYWGGPWTMGPPPSYWMTPPPRSSSDQYSSTSSIMTPTTSTSSSCRDESPAIKKRPRDEQERSDKNKVLVVPKTLRMTDPKEAAKSSIWTTLGRISGKSDEGVDHRSQKINNIRMLTGSGFGSEEEEMTGGVVLQANPAAFSMSLKFRETPR